MKPCPEIQLRLNDLLDAGESKLPVAVRAHLDACPECRAWWEQTRETENVLRESTSADAERKAPASLEGRIRAALEREAVVASERNSKTGSRRRWLAAVAATLVVAAGIATAVFLSRSGSPGRDSTPLRAPIVDEYPETVHPGGGKTTDVAQGTDAFPAVAAPPSLAALPSWGDLILAAAPVEDARQDLRWLTRAVVSNAESAARAFAPADAPPSRTN